MNARDPEAKIVGSVGIGIQNFISLKTFVFFFLFFSMSCRLQEGLKGEGKQKGILTRSENRGEDEKNENNAGMLI